MLLDSDPPSFMFLPIAQLIDLTMLYLFSERARFLSVIVDYLSFNIRVFSFSFILPYKCQVLKFKCEIFRSLGLLHSDYLKCWVKYFSEYIGM